MKIFNRTVARFLVTTSFALLTAFPASAGVTVTNLNGGSDWRTTGDAQVATQWVIGNFSDDGDAATPVSGTNIPAHSMWGPDGLQNWFGRQFVLKPSASSVAGALSIIADDYMELFINGQFLFSAILDDNQNGTAPVPLVLDIDGFDVSLSSGTTLFPDLTIPPDSLSFVNLLQIGVNTIVIRGMDGYLTDTQPDGPSSCPESLTFIRGDHCFDNRERVNAYVHVGGSIQAVPEPATLGLFGLGLAGLGLAARRRKTA